MFEENLTHHCQGDFTESYSADISQYSRSFARVNQSWQSTTHWQAQPNRSLHAYCITAMVQFSFHLGFLAFFPPIAFRNIQYILSLVSTLLSTRVIQVVFYGCGWNCKKMWSNSIHSLAVTGWIIFSFTFFHFPPSHNVHLPPIYNGVPGWWGKTWFSILNVSGS